MDLSEIECETDNSAMWLIIVPWWPLMLRMLTPLDSVARVNDDQLTLQITDEN
jgi:hypothetical protein